MARSRVELEVLALVVADGDPVGVVEEDVRGLEDRVREKADAGASLPATLLLELRHPVELAHRRGALEQPGQPLVLGDVALDEERADLRVEAGGEQVDRGLHRARPEHGRVDLERQGVEVDDAVERVVVVLVGHPLADGAQVVPQMEITGRLHARKDPGHGATW